MASSITLPNLKVPALKSHFLGQTHLPQIHRQLSFPAPNRKSATHVSACSKFNLFEIMGGRGLCNGEKGLEQELERGTDPAPSSPGDVRQEDDSVTENREVNIPDDAFEKELLGLTGGFPGGEKGLQKFIEQNPPPKKASSDSIKGKSSAPVIPERKKPSPPELPLLMPGMIAIVKNPNHPFYMYTGIVQRITDGKAGVLFEGGNWDHLITFRLEELERRDKGPPGKNPKSAILEPMLQENQQE